MNGFPQPASPNGPQTREEETTPAADRLATIRESIDLLEADLAKLIGEAESAVDEVRVSAGSSRQALQAICDRAERLACRADDDAKTLASTSQEFVRSSDEIGRQMQRANALTEDARRATVQAGDDLGQLNVSSSEIGSVVGLIAKIAQQTNLLALNAKIESSRAGEAGRAFAVVADEVKALSNETYRATQEIRERVQHLQRVAQVSVATLTRITTVIDEIRPVYAAVGIAIEDQRSVAQHLSRNADMSVEFIRQMAVEAGEINQAAQLATGQSEEIDTSAQRAAQLTSKLQARLGILLRQTDFGDRRRFDRLPCELRTIVRFAGRLFKGSTVDLGHQGALVRCEDAAAIEAGTNCDLDLAGIGDLRARLVNRSSIGLHFCFLDADPDVRQRLEKCLAAIEAESRHMVEGTVATAMEISQCLEALVTGGRISTEALFDNDYVAIPNTRPQQYRTRYLDLLEQVIPEIQERFLGSDPRMVLCTAVDRNGYLPVHNRKYSHPQRLGDPEWNVAHCRNRRILDDRAGLVGARNIRPYLIQTYPRDMGGGEIAMMKEIDAPIRVLGRHWGCFRVAYRL